MNNTTNEQKRQAILALFNEITAEEKEYYAMLIIMNMAQIAGGDSLAYATGIIESAKQELRECINNEAKEIAHTYRGIAN